MEHIYQHFRKDEKEFIDLALDWVDRAEQTYSPVLTPFLDPRQKYIVQSLVGQNSDLTFQSFGGMEHAERERAFIAPEYFKAELEDFEISLVEINYPVKFNELKHGQVLGTLMGSGLKRNKFGDIVTDGSRWQLMLDQKIESFVLLQIDRIGKAKVKLESLDFNGLIEIKDEWHTKEEIVSSLRLDNVISSTLNLSREKAKTLIKSNRVKLNWSVNTSPNEEVDTGDVLSVRGFGRIRFNEVLTRTKKDKFLIEIDVLDNKG